MKVVLVKPGQPAEITEINGLAEMQQAVGGYIEAIYPFNGPVALVCNEDGKSLHMPCNCVLKAPDGSLADIVCGTFFICGTGEEDFISLTDEAAEHFKKLFTIPRVSIAIE